MKTTGISTVAEYLESLPEDRRKTIQQVRAYVKKHMPKGYTETFDWGGIIWAVPLKVCPDTYNGKPLAYTGLVNQKNHIGLYLMGSYMNPKLQQRLTDGFKASGKRLDMGKACVRFRKIEDLALEPIAEVIAAIPMADFVAYTLKVHGKKQK